MLEGQASAQADLRADDPVPAVKSVLYREHVHRSALAARNAGSAAGQLGHDDVGVDAVSQHMAVIAIAGDDAVQPRLQRRLQPHRDCFLADIQMAEAADQAEAVKLPGLFLEAADQQHLLVQIEQLVLAGLIALRFRWAFAIGDCRRRAVGRDRLSGSSQETAPFELWIAPAIGGDHAGSQHSDIDDKSTSATGSAYCQRDR